MWTLSDTEFDIRSLHRDKVRLLLKQGGQAPGFSPDDGTGKKEIYRVENFELAPVDRSAYGMFFGGDSYVIKYTYNKNGREQNIIYFWQVSQHEHARLFQCQQLTAKIWGKKRSCREMTAARTKRHLRLFTP